MTSNPHLSINRSERQVHPSKIRGGAATPAPNNEHVRKLAWIGYIVVGVLVASQHDYYAHLSAVSEVVSAVVATALWPLLLFGAGLHLSLG